MIPFTLFTMLREEPNVNLNVDANTLLWAILTGLVVVVGFFITSYMRTQATNFDKIEHKVDHLDQRMDKMEVSQAKILIKLGIE